MFKQSEPWSSFTHFIAWVFAIVALVYLVVLAVQKGTVWHVVTFAIFGTGLVLLYGVSTAYHIIPKPSRAKYHLRNLDHSMIYVLIAATYTPLCLTVLRGPWGWTFFGVAWGLAAIGIVFRNVPAKLPEAINFALFLVMGWMIIVGLGPLSNAVSKQGLWWLFLGGVFYTVGAVFYAVGARKGQKHAFGFHEIFHVFVIAGSISHFYVMLGLL